jgi:hypothetical protein
MIDKIKESARDKIEAKLWVAEIEANSPDLYWKIDKERQIELNKRDKFEVEVWSYILSLIEKDNKLW